MKSVSQDTITDAFVACCENTASPRLKLVLSKLAAHMHAFAREVGLTHEEWQTAMTLLGRAGQISTPERSEFILFSDVLGLTSLVDMINSGGVYLGFAPSDRKTAPYMKVVLRYRGTVNVSAF